MKNFVKVSKLVAIFLATTMASVFFTGCSQANEREEESSKESVVVNIVEEESDESSEEEASVEESIVESVVESSVESSVESQAESSVESEEASVESSIEESEIESSVEESSEVESETYSLSDIIGYGRTIERVQPQKEGFNGIAPLSPGTNLCIVKVNDTTCDVYVSNTYVTVEKDKIEIFSDDYIPDFSIGIPWYGLTVAERRQLSNWFSFLSL